MLKLEPIIWGLFSAGMMVGGLLLPVGWSYGPVSFGGRFDIYLASLLALLAAGARGSRGEAERALT